MKKSCQILLLSVALIIFFCGIVNAEDPNGPKMLIKETVFDFKEIKAEEYIEHTFAVLNEGDQPLEISKVNTG